MVRSTEEILESLITGISKMEEVQAIGVSGSKAPLPKAGEGDIDIFIYCDMIPEAFMRKDIINKLSDIVPECRINTLQGGHWGVGDFVLINGVETWLMYFTVNDTKEDIESILNGSRPDKQDNYYYPIGRCAMLKDINVLYDKNDFLHSLKKDLHVYPDKLAGILIQYHLGGLEDIEDLERAVSRKDVLFYHFALEIALDHFLQALFALNRVYFPSRKRNIELIGGFSQKPENCSERLLEIVRLGGCSGSIDLSYESWRDLVNELKEICKY